MGAIISDYGDSGVIRLVCVRLTFYFHGLELITFITFDTNLSTEQAYEVPSIAVKEWVVKKPIKQEAARLFFLTIMHTLVLNFSSDVHFCLSRRPYTW